MDYSRFTPEILTQRFSSLPEHIQELLQDEQTDKLITQIAKSHYLPREKIVILKQLIGLVLLGFLEMSDFRTEVIDRLFLNFEHATALTNELNSELFNPIKGDLAQIYYPLEESGVRQERDMIPTASVLSGFSAPHTETGKELETPIPIHEAAGDDSAPLVLHDAKPSPFAAGERVHTSFKDLSKSFSFFAQKISPREIQNTPVKARVEAPKNNNSINSPQIVRPPAGRSPQERVVHYNESRPGGDDFINLEAFGGGSSASRRITTSDPASPKPREVVYETPAQKSPTEPVNLPRAIRSPATGSPQKETRGTIQDEVSLEGNTINLRE